ncbi:MAG: M15 family metallopeptidase [Acetatifactor sp.]|nr:M15 family metallopeptidase [Acetatifactor sp.]
MSLTEYASQEESQNSPLSGPAVGVVFSDWPDASQNRLPENSTLSEIPQDDHVPSPGDADTSPDDTPSSPDDKPSSPDDALSSPGSKPSSPDDAPSSPGGGSEEPPSTLVGAFLNGTSQTDQRVEYQEGFYYEPLSDRLCRYITGISYPAESGDENAAPPAITLDQLRYVHILHYDFEGNSVEGELICNASIAQDLVEIFYELHRNEYMLEKVLLIDEYNGDDTASMEDNNTSCFNYRVVEGTQTLSRHAYGLAVDVNPLYNPYITYEKDGTEIVSPAAALDYADRSARFAYKIDDEDLCYKLFTSHGFTWGGNWNQSKDYQHFQKSLP